ncbi:MAG: hypothetical protein GXO21_05305 [Aquificae bacterium]|nr:hypothetical protein [Aquificota bacterium]
MEKNGNTSEINTGNTTNNGSNDSNETGKGNTLNEFSQKLKELGFNSLEEVAKLKEEYNKILKQKEHNKSLEEKLLKLEKLYKTEKIRSEVIKLATKYNAIEPEDLFILTKEKAEITEDGNIFIDGKPLEEFVKELKEKRPHWFKADDKEGSGTSGIKEPKRELSAREKIAKIKKFKG